MTAEAIREPQDPKPPPTTKLPLLREQDFGFYEGKTFFERPSNSSKSGKETHQVAHRDDPRFRDVESKESMRKRTEDFVLGHLTKLLYDVDESHTVVVVAHGIILSHLWRTLLKNFQPGNVSVTSNVQNMGRGFSLEHLGMWLNTGYLDLEIRQASALKAITESSQSVASNTISQASVGIQEHIVSDTTQPAPLKVGMAESCNPLSPPTSANLSAKMFLDLSLVVKAVNSQQHLKGLKKTRGGIGSLKHDSSQKTMESFFKKRKLG